MALNGLAGAGKAKTTILESKGIFEKPCTGEVQFLGGRFNKSKKKPTFTTVPINKQESVGSFHEKSKKDGEGQGGRDLKANGQAGKGEGEQSFDPKGLGLAHPR
jgi:hypothetical protein